MLVPGRDAVQGRINGAGPSDLLEPRALRLHDEVLAAPSGTLSAGAKGEVAFVRERSHATGKTVNFTQMKDGTREEYERLHELEQPFLAPTANRVLDELRRQEHVTLDGYRLTRLQHGLQSATRAECDGADIDWIVAALLHDIGDGLAPQNHDRMSAEVIRPFVRWDQASFDPDYDARPLAHFDPMVREVFARKAYDPAVLRDGFVSPLVAA